LLIFKNNLNTLGILNGRKEKNVNNSGNWIGVGAALGAAVFALTKDIVFKYKIFIYKSYMYRGCL